jgi:hypothetical protein
MSLFQDDFTPEKGSPVLQILSSMAAIVAACLWLLSAVIKTPQSFAIYVACADSPLGTPLGDNPMGGSYVGQAYSDDLLSLANGLRRQSRLSALAAIFAGASALLQGISILIR